MDNNSFKKIVIVFLVVLSLPAYSQDPQFSQFYAHSLYLNPAFTGNTNLDRVSGVYRNQWTSIPGAFVSYSFAYDHNFTDLNSGLGLMFTKDKAGSGGLKFTNVAGLYSYNLKINRKWALRSGFKFSYTSRAIDKSRLTFGDQIARGGAAETVEGFSDGANSYIDLGTGAIIYSEKFWSGVSIDHINQPEQSFLSGTAFLPIKLSLHGGYNFLTRENIKGDEESSVTLTYNYKHQQNWSQLDIGAYYNRSGFVLGMWYRGIPIVKTASLSNNDALVILLGFQSKGLRIGYSYDVTISKLAGDIGGTHEITLVFENPYEKKKQKKKRHFVPCAKF
jgi:type IX secretion system PorP/SprF family membrane protein